MNSYDNYNSTLLVIFLKNFLFIFTTVYLYNEPCDYIHP